MISISSKAFGKIGTFVKPINVIARNGSCITHLQSMWSNEAEQARSAFEAAISEPSTEALQAHHLGRAINISNIKNDLFAGKGVVSGNSITFATGDKKSVSIYSNGSVVFTATPYEEQRELMNIANSLRGDDIPSKLFLPDAEILMWNVPSEADASSYSVEGLDSALASCTAVNYCVLSLQYYIWNLPTWSERDRAIGAWLYTGILSETNLDVAPKGFTEDQWRSYKKGANLESLFNHFSFRMQIVQRQFEIDPEYVFPIPAYDAPLSLKDENGKDRDLYRTEHFTSAPMRYA